MKAILTTILCVFLMSSISGQTGHNIDVKINGYVNDTLIVGYYFADRQLVLDTLYNEEIGSFKIQGDESLDPGMYLVLTLPDRQVGQFMVPADDQEFKLEFNILSMRYAKVEGSHDNQMFQDYLVYIGECKGRADDINAQIEQAGEDVSKRAALEEELNDLDDEVNAHLAKLIEENPSTVTSLLLKSNVAVPMPEFEGDPEQVKLDRYYFYKEHYFDNLDFTNPALLRTAFLHAKVEYYLDKLTPQQPDSVSRSLDVFLSKMDEDSEVFKAYLSHYLTKYAKSKYIGHDAIYVHLIQNYYAKDKAPWVEEETLLKMKDEARRLAPVLIGKTAADIQMFKEDGTTVSVSELDYEFLVMYFWDPDCGHCKKSTPKLVEFEKNYKDKGVKVMALCTALRDKTANCWNSVKEKDMLGFINVTDENHKSRFKLKYNIKTTPTIFVLDKNREILVKGLGVEQLPEVMDNMIEQAKKQEGL